MVSGVQLAGLMLNFDPAALAYVAETRVQEARSLRALVGSGPLSAAAAAYLEGVEALFKAIRELDSRRCCSDAGVPRAAAPRVLKLHG